MTKYLDGGITRNGEGTDGTEWTILGQRYLPKATCASTFAFETMSAPGQFVPVHIHPHQDQFILVQEGELELKLDGEWQTARAGDLVRMPRGVPHGHFNKSGAPCRAKRRRRRRATLMLRVPSSTVSSRFRYSRFSQTLTARPCLPGPPMRTPSGL